MNNVVKFPGQYHHRPGNTPITLEEIKIAKQDVSTVHVEEATADLIEYIVTTLPVYGFIFLEKDNDYAKNIGLLVESLRSLLFKYHGMEHPLQIVADNLFTEIEPGILSLKQVEMEDTEEVETNT